VRYKDASGGIKDIDKRSYRVVGYASHFDNIDSHNDIIRKGAFKRTINNNGKRVKTLMHHDQVMIVGRPEEMTEDDAGLLTVTSISKTALGNDLIVLIEDGVLDEMSIGYVPVSEKVDKDSGVRVISEVKLIEYSFVSLASNELARVQGFKGLHSREAITDSMRRMEKALRDGNFMTDEVPETLEFALKYWREALTSIDNGVEVVKDAVVVLSDEQGADSPDGTRALSHPAASTGEDILQALKSWQEEQEILAAIHKIGKSLEVK
jgi:HK97 family phage prohead protease